MKKIKILTLIGNNYGGALQAYALYHTIKKYDKNVSIINYSPFFGKLSLKDYIKKIVYIKRDVKFNLFRKKMLNLTAKLSILEDDKNSLYIVGSDQVWNPSIDISVRENYYLKFVSDSNRKNSYAASIGTNYIDDNENNIKTITDLLSQFNYITVREQTANDILNRVINKKIYTVLDPTLLMKQEEWKKISKKYNHKEKYVCVYTLGLNRSVEGVIDSFSKEYNKKIIDIFYKKRFSNELKHENGFGPIEFISVIENSDFVITNSFHGTVFALLFHKKFITITRGDMNSRIYDLLKTLKLQDRILTENDGIEKYRLTAKKDINYEEVDRLLEVERNNSLKHLKNILNVKESE